MEAARAAALAGHKVILYEQSPRLGGQFAVAAVPPAKGRLWRILPGRGGSLGKVGCGREGKYRVHAGSGSERQAGYRYCGEWFCTCEAGGPGYGRKGVVTAEDVLMGRYSPGRKVVIIGGGMVGCETATFSPRWGAGDGYRDAAASSDGWLRHAVIF